MTEAERVDCTDCFALPGPGNTHVVYVKTGGGISETGHTSDCPALAITQINMEEGSKRKNRTRGLGASSLPRTSGSGRPRLRCPPAPPHSPSAMP
ncbi:hypothetical protein [Streptomyces sp900116325]|uniref:hypothetical protein n=1 Tax=Streptomyces sp. 900116325 TaxID=3154295 RepID=UPI003317E929